jgi:hypothetical protein
MKPSAKRCLDFLERSGCWVPLWQLMNPAIGGTSAARRLREIKEEGIPVEWRYSDKPGSRETYYRIKTQPVQMEMAI